MHNDVNFGPDLPVLFKLHAIWSVDSQENHKNCCHHMSYLKAKIHKNWQPGLEVTQGVKVIESAIQ